jgi:hypothetical protein
LSKGLREKRKQVKKKLKEQEFQERGGSGGTHPLTLLTSKGRGNNKETKELG